MATIDELKREIAAIKGTIATLEGDLTAITNEILDANIAISAAEKAGNTAEVTRQRAIVRDLRDQRSLAEASIERNNNLLGPLGSQLSRAEQAAVAAAAAAAVQTQQKARDDAGQPTVNSGAVVITAQTAKDDNANPFVPPGGLPPATVPSNAAPTPTEIPVNSGTDAPVRNSTETQATNPNQPPGQGRPLRQPGQYDPNAAPGSTVDPRVPIVAKSQPGAAAGGDDQRNNTTPSQETNQTTSRLDALYGGSTPEKPAITAQTNILSNFASYTYSLSWYLVDPVAYQELVTQQRRSLNGFYLLVQSAGIGQNLSQTVASNQLLNLNQQSPQVTAASAGRNQFFPLDYYIDNFETEVLYPAGGASQSAAAFKNLSFTVTEPNGLTLLPNLYSACQDLIKQGGELFATNDRINYAAAMFCMVIRFYGYDANGVLQTPITSGRGSTDRDAVVEKFIPFVLKKIDFSVGPRMVEYTIEGGAPEVITGLATNRGSIPQNFDFSGVTVRDILVGASTPSTQEVTPATSTDPRVLRSLGRIAASQADATPPKAPSTADSAPKPVTNTVATGLVAALTEFQERLVANKTVEHADVYEITFADSILSDAKVAPPGGLNKNRVGGNPNNTAADQKLPEKSAIAPSTRARSVTAGTQIIQFIDQVLRNSSYITDQQAVIFNEKTKNYQPSRGQPAQQFAWFQVTVLATPFKDKYDRKRNDYAYKMTFYITPYEVPMVSEYFAPSGFRGVHKIYNYLFTGENTEVLQFEQSFDKLWTQALTADANIQELVQQQKRQMNSREQWKRHNYAASGQSNQGGEGKVFEAGANAADFLYGPNYGSININIVGDPAWIPNAYYEYNTNTFTSAPFWPDGTVNSQASVPYFEMAFNRPVDYNLATGLMDPGQKNYFADRDKGQAGLAAESQTYVAVSCKSVFKGGRFSQDLEGAWMWDQTINEPKNERTAQTPPVIPSVNANQSAAETARLERSGPPVTPKSLAESRSPLQKLSPAQRGPAPPGGALGSGTLDVPVPATPILTPGLAPATGGPPRVVREP